MQQSAQVKREAESVLRTRAMREGDAARKKRKYRRCLVRVRFPDQTVLQAVFLPREKLAKVYELVTDSLATPCPFSLFTHPLRTELADQDATLLDADLVPVRPTMSCLETAQLTRSGLGPGVAGEFPMSGRGQLSGGLAAAGADDAGRAPRRSNCQQGADRLVAGGAARPTGGAGPGAARAGSGAG